MTGQWSYELNGWIRRPYVRMNHNRFGDSYIVIACACGAGSTGTQDEPLQPPHRPPCPLANPPAAPADSEGRQP